MQTSRSGILSQVIILIYCHLTPDTMRNDDESKLTTSVTPVNFFALGPEVVGSYSGLNIQL